MLLILLVVALGGWFGLEQPLGSVMEYYPAFRSMLAAIFKNGGIHSVGILVSGMFGPPNLIGFVSI